MNKLNEYGERCGHWMVLWDNINPLYKEKPRYIWVGYYVNGKPSGLFKYFTYSRKLHNKEFYL